MRELVLMTCALAFLGCAGPSASVRIDLPLPPKLDLSTFDKVYFPGFLITSKDQMFNTQYDAINFLKREFKRRADMEIAELEPMPMEKYDARDFLLEKQPLFTEIELEGREGTLAVTGVINFAAVDRSGFRDMPVTDSQGRQFYRSQFVEITGYVLDINVHVYQMETGELIYRELLKDAMDIEGPPDANQLVFFELLDRISLRIIGLFSNTQVKAERQLL